MNAYAMRRKDRELSEEAALEALQKAPFATISCITPDGFPYGVTVSHAVEDRTLYFHCAMQGFKSDCFAAIPRSVLRPSNGPKSTRPTRRRNTVRLSPLEPSVWPKGKRQRTGCA